MSMWNQDLDLITTDDLEGLCDELEMKLDEGRAELVCREEEKKTTSEITLRITTAANSIPSEWDWTTLLDLGGDEAVEVVGYGTNVDAERERDG